MAPCNDTLKSKPGQVVRCWRKEYFATPPEPFSQVTESGSYDTISKVHSECLPHNDLFVQFSFQFHKELLSEHQRNTAFNMFTRITEV